MASDDAPIAEMDTALARRFDIVLQPLSHPELGEIRIASALFAVGRAEPPFASARAGAVAELSRRHAKIFFERGEAYVADLGSKNGTSVDGEPVRERPRRLADGNTLSFAGALTYRVVFVPHDARSDAANARAVMLTLKPERNDLGLEPIVVTTFPFLVSKTDETFARYRSTYAHQVNYLSRRHAHFFVVDGRLFVEDLGSTNGTFIDDERLEEGARVVEDGARVAFGGNHFVYRVSVSRGSAADPTLTQVAAAGPPPAHREAGEPALPAPLMLDADRTTFVGAAHSFLDIFCVDPARADEDEVNPEAPRHVPASAKTVRRAGWPTRFAEFVRELYSAFGGSGELDFRRIGRFAAIALVTVCALGALIFVRGAPQREMKSLLAAGRFDEAGAYANRYLASHPGDAAFQAQGSQALMKAQAPQWIAAVKSRAFDRAHSIVDDMKEQASHNAAALLLVDQMAWVGELEAYWDRRGAAEGPIAIYRDEPVIEGLIARWNDDPNAHQHVLDQIASYVPAFGDVYADALSHLRKLQSDDSVYVAALDRLKAAISSALDEGRDDRFDGLTTMLAEYADRYPRLAGLDRVRDDLAKYRQLLADLRAGHTGEVAETLRKIHFATPAFQARVPELAKRAARAKGNAP